MPDECQAAARIRELFASRDYALLKTELAKAAPQELARAWPALAPMEKAACFKLIDAPEDAMAFFKTLPFEERYFLLGAFDLGALAPLLEDAPPKVRSLFRRMPEEAYGEMLLSLGAG
ncbi:MAG: hypothetical protein HY078_13020 [Elusimicrobia bacterium]|nr:hypothetical protein [Elusimicrobiota bacterium]